MPVVNVRTVDGYNLVKLPGDLGLCCAGKGQVEEGGIFGWKKLSEKFFH